ncbi:MAG TPA: sigma-70 family RNA polymerase sigma factor [Gemmataceae bacterium]|nr:sigma-70 family RNA polymerase sigma factor [Gemmataceae bacterium]
MNQETADQRLSSMQTFWTVICRANGRTPEAVAAQEELLRRYGRAVHRYLLASLRDADAAEELSQEFALRFVRGDMHRADPERGRFRDFVKGVLFHLIDHHRRRRRKALQPLNDAVEAAAAPGPSEADMQFLESWKAELLDRAWTALADHERSTGQPFHAVLRFRVKRPELRSAEMAEELSRRLGKPLSAVGVRQTLHRARDRFADLLLAEVLQTLQAPTTARLEEELMDLGLLDYCRPALDRLRQGSA